MPTPMLPTRLLVALFCGFPGLACSTSGGTAGSLEPPARAFVFPSQAFVGPVTAQARLYSDHESIFGEDLIQEYGLVPIALTIGLANARAEREAKIFPEDMKLRLYLQDGSVLSAIDARKPTADDAELLAKVRDESLKPGLLMDFASSREGMVFFELEKPGNLEWIEPLIARDTAREGSRTIDLSNSLCAFDVTIGLEQVSVFVGLDVDSRGKRR